MFLDMEALSFELGSARTVLHAHSPCNIETENNNYLAWTQKLEKFGHKYINCSQRNFDSALQAKSFPVALLDSVMHSQVTDQAGAARHARWADAHHVHLSRQGAHARHPEAVRVLDVVRDALCCRGAHTRVFACSVIEAARCSKTETSQASGMAWCSVGKQIDIRRLLSTIPTSLMKEGGGRQWPTHAVCRVVLGCARPRRGSKDHQVILVKLVAKSCSAVASFVKPHPYLAGG